MKIIEYLKGKKYCSMEELQEHFHVSCATIHRDVSALISRGVLQKIYGGVSYPEMNPERKKNFFSLSGTDRVE